MAQLSGRRVLVTGASGLVALPVAVELAKSNEVYAVARFSNSEQKRLLEAAGAHLIAFDLSEHDLSPLPRSVDVVINYAVLPPNYKEHYEVNAGAVGRLARRYRDCEAFIQGSTGSLYAYQGERPLREDDPYGLHSSAEPYAASKIAAEFLLKHLSEDYRMPTVIVRIFSFYGPRGGGVTQRIDQVAQGQPVSVYPGVRNVHTPLFEDDYVEKTIAAIGIAKTPAEIVNLGGTEAVTTQEYCEIAGEILGKKPIFVENSKAWPIWADRPYKAALCGHRRRRPGGIALGARLRRLGVPAIIVEKNERARRFLAQALQVPLPARPGLVRPPALSAVSRRTGRCSAEGQDRRLARDVHARSWSSTTGAPRVQERALDEAKKDGRSRSSATASRSRSPAQLVLATGMSAEPNMPSFPGMERLQGRPAPHQPASGARRLRRQEGGGDRLQQFGARHLRGAVGARRRRDHGAAQLDPYRAQRHADGPGLGSFTPKRRWRRASPRTRPT